MLSPNLNNTAVTYAPALDKDIKPHGEQVVCVVGHDENASEVKKCLDGLNVGGVFYSDVKDLTNKIDPRIKSVIFVEPLLGVRSAIKKLKNINAFSHIPVFVVTKSMLENNLMKELYKLGVEAVIKFPDDKPIFTFILSHFENETSYTAPVKSLKRRVVKRLKSNLSQINSFWKGGLKKIKPGFGDMTIPRTTKTSLADSRFESLLVRKCHDSGLPLETVSISASQGNIVVGGCVPSKVMKSKISNIAESMSEAKSISNLSVVSAKRWLRDRRVAKKMQRKIAERYQGQKFIVTVMRSTAIIRGKIVHARQRQAIMKMIQANQLIDNVIDKTVSA